MITEFKRLIPNLRKVTDKKYRSVCPLCRKKDFSVYYGNREKWLFKCFDCNQSGDIIDFKKLIGLSVSKDDIEEKAGSSSQSGQSVIDPTQDLFTEHRPATFNQEEIRQIVNRCYNQLETAYQGLFYKQPQQHPQELIKKIQWLENERFLSLNSVQLNRLGWNTHPVKFQNGKNFHAGLIVPYYGDKGDLLKVRVRLKNPIPDGVNSKRAPKFIKYLLIDGSSLTWSQYRYQPGKSNQVGIIVESDLDAILLNQITGFTCYASTSVNQRPDWRNKPQLDRHELILDCLDSDNKNGWLSEKLKRYFKGKYIRLPPVAGKDPCEIKAAGVDLIEWINAGIEFFIKRTGKTIQKIKSLHVESVAREPPKKENSNLKTQTQLVYCRECKHSDPYYPKMAYGRIKIPSSGFVTCSLSGQVRSKLKKEKCSNFKRR